MKLNEYVEAIERKYKLDEGLDKSIKPIKRKKLNEDALGSSNEATEQFDRLYKAIKNTKSESLQIQYWLKNFIDEFYRSIDVKKLNEIYSDFIEANKFIDKAESSAKFGCGKVNESYNLREAKYGPYAPQDGWTEEDIELHKSIDWPSRNYFDYPVESDSFEGQAILYSTEFDGGKKYVPATFIKYIRSNPLFPPYYAPKDMDKTGFVGPMYDGNNHGSYQIHDRYETEEIYRALSWD